MITRLILAAICLGQAQANASDGNPLKEPKLDARALCREIVQGKSSYKSATEDLRRAIQELNDETAQVHKLAKEKITGRQGTLNWLPKVVKSCETVGRIADSIRMHRSDGSLIRLVTGIGHGETIDSAQARLLSLAAAITPVINDYVPR